MDRKKKTTWKAEKQAVPILRKMYLNPEHPVGFAGAKHLVDVAHAKGVKPSTQNWLESQLAYALHKPARKRFKRDCQREGRTMASRSCACASVEEGQRLVSFSSHGDRCPVEIFLGGAWSMPSTPFSRRTVESLNDRGFSLERNRVLRRWESEKLK